MNEIEFHIQFVFMIRWIQIGDIINIISELKRQALIANAEASVAIKEGFFVIWDWQNGAFKRKTLSELKALS